MCGIAGFCLNKREHLPLASDIVDALLLEIEERGYDSTGMAWSNRNGTFIRKDAVPAKSFVRRGSTKRVNKGGVPKVVLLHTRFATQGSKANPANNHPIMHGDVIGVHNGHINNDDSIFKTLGVKRHGQVDSEAAFALLNALSTDEQTIAFPELRGRAALAWMDRRDGNETLHLARVDGSPLAIGMTKRGSFFFASTMKLLHDAMELADVDLAWDMDVAEGTYLRVRNGSIVHWDTFDVPRPYMAGGWTPYSTVEREHVAKTYQFPSRWYDYDGEWIDDDTFVPYTF